MRGIIAVEGGEPELMAELILETLSEMLLAPTYPDIDSERQVVLEEIAMYDDEPAR